MHGKLPCGRLLTWTRVRAVGWLPTWNRVGERTNSAAAAEARGASCAAAAASPGRASASAAPTRRWYSATLARSAPICGARHLVCGLVLSSLPQGHWGGHHASRCRRAAWQSQQLPVAQFNAHMWQCVCVLASTIMRQPWQQDSNSCRCQVLGLSSGSAGQLQPAGLGAAT
jgi:hypothetical protein